ncbi:MAG: SpoIIIAH-like family protein [Oscillospiraceae bacterium]|nr:MAG: SpoIIIAH-like family protein [Oscillospiraceae bacterium]
MFRINKKVLVIAGLAILLAVTGVLNWKFAADKKARQQAEGNGGGTEQTVSSFADFRTERERVRTQELTSIDSIINNETPTRRHWRRRRK